MNLNSKFYGFLFCLLAYTLWGLFPYFYNFIQVDPFSILIYRGFLSFFTIFLLLLLLKRFVLLKLVFKDYQKLALLFLVALSLAGNWLFFILGVAKNQFFQISFGYFLCPLISIFFAVVFYKEKLSTLRKVALVFAFLGILNELFFSQERVSYIAVGVALSFAFYALFKKKLNIDLYVSLTFEFFIITLFLLLSNFFFLKQVNFSEGFFQYDNFTLILLFIAGSSTIIPLLLYAAAIQKLELTTVSLMFYISPTIQFFIANFVLNQKLNYQMFFSFLLIWIALIIYSYDLFFTREVLKNKKHL